MRHFFLVEPRYRMGSNYADKKGHHHDGDEWTGINNTRNDYNRCCRKKDDPEDAIVNDEVFVFSHFWYLGNTNIHIDLFQIQVRIKIHMYLKWTKYGPERPNIPSAEQIDVYQQRVQIAKI